MVARYGIIGNPLAHSFSPAYFAEKFRKLGIEASYERFELNAITEFPNLLKTHPQLRGLNVTIPYKQSIIPYLDSLSEAAQQIGAVNCIGIESNRLKGYNTDVIGFEQSLTPLLRPCHTKALVLGTGGSSMAVIYVLKRLGIEYLSVSRQPKINERGYADLTRDVLQDYLLIVNTTPLGMSPENDTCPDIPYEALGSKHLLYDLVYNPQETKFLALGKAQGAATKNGLEMLHLQAEASWEIWNQPTV